jgi:hypothetical protein
VKSFCNRFLFSEAGKPAAELYLLFHIYDEIQIEDFLFLQIIQKSKRDTA